MKIRLLLIISLLLAALTGCHSNDIYDEMPQQIQLFISQYFPNSEVQSFSRSGAIYHIRIANGPGMTFDEKYAWTNVNGSGTPLPQVFLFDQLPPAVYEYLQETSRLDAVFAAERTDKTYTLQLLDSTITYDIATRQITGTVPKG